MPYGIIEPYWLVSSNDLATCSVPSHYLNQCLLIGDWFLRNKLWSWWHHQMETFSALLALYEGNSPVTGEFPSQRPVMWSFDVLFDLCLNKRLSKQSWGWWLETSSCSLWRHCNVKFLGAGVIFSSEPLVCYVTEVTIAIKDAIQLIAVLFIERFSACHWLRVSYWNRGR